MNTKAAHTHGRWLPEWSEGTTKGGTPYVWSWIAFVEAAERGQEAPVAEGVQVSGGNRHANAERLAACWNACEGMETSDLQNSRAVLMDSYDAVREQRDELLEALKGMLEGEGLHSIGCKEYPPGHDDSRCCPVHIARAAIAKAEGK